MFRTITLAPFAFMALGAASVIEAPAGQVHVTDADTIRVGSVKVRFDGVDAPERGHPVHDPGITYLVREVWAADSVRCELTGAKTHDREVGTCFLIKGGVERNMLQMVVEAGVARDCPRFSGGRYAEFETDASRALPIASFCKAR